MEIIGYMAAGLIGLSLGLIGGGGSILTVPVLVYLFGVAPTTATSYSLFIVGATSFTGACNNSRNHQIDKKAVLYFGAASVAAMFVVRQFLLPAVPDHLFRIGNHTITKSFLTMLLFALLMLAASRFMIRNRTQTDLCHTPPKKTKLLFFGLMIGTVTGILGGGGGFLLIPALIRLLKMPMKKAVGTSLAIIAATALFGFAVDLWQYTIEWLLVIPVTAIAVAGIVAGTRLRERINGAMLKKAFGWFVLAMGLFVLVSQLLSLQST